MTFERKIVVGLEDIASISLECVECKRRISFGPDAQGQIPHACGCGHPWISSTASSPTPLDVFLQMLKRIRETFRSNPYGVRILLEYTEPQGKGN